MGRTPHAPFQDPSYALPRVERRRQRCRRCRRRAPQKQQDIGVGRWHEELVEGYEISFVDSREARTCHRLLKGLPTTGAPARTGATCMKGRGHVHVRRPREAFEAGDAFYVRPGPHLRCRRRTASSLIFSPAEQSPRSNEVIRAATCRRCRAPEPLVSPARAPLRRGVRAGLRTGRLRPGWTHRSSCRCARCGSRPSCGEITRHRGDVLVRESPREQSQDFDLARRKPGRALATPRDAVSGGAENGLDRFGVHPARLHLGPQLGRGRRLPTARRGTDVARASLGRRRPHRASVPTARSLRRTARADSRTRRAVRGAARRSRRTERVRRLLQHPLGEVGVPSARAPIRRHRAAPACPRSSWTHRVVRSRGRSRHGGAFVPRRPVSPSRAAAPRDEIGHGPRVSERVRRLQVDEVGDRQQRLVEPLAGQRRRRARARRRSRRPTSPRVSRSARISSASRKRVGEVGIELLAALALAPAPSPRRRRRSDGQPR